MALDFNLLRPASGPNPVSAFYQGQQDVARNALAQEEAAQARELNALRRQQVTGQIQAQEDVRRKQTVAEKTGMFRERLLRAPNAQAARELVKMQYADPDISAVLSQGGTLEQALAEVPDDPTQFERYRAQEAMGMAEWLKSQMPKMTPTGDVFDPATREFIRKPQPAAAPVRQPPMVEEFNFARSPEGGGFQGSYQDFVIAREAAKRAPAPARAAGGGGMAMPKAPPGYRYAPTGDLEAIPGGPAAAKLGEAVAKKDEGVVQASNILDSLEAAYTDLEARRAIPSEKRNAVANTLASISASAPGQIAERTIGTKAQTQRDVIASSRLQLLNAIKGATGMSSQQLNSNVELTTWLNSLTDPSRSIETNREILQNVRRFIDSGGTYTAKQGGKSAPAAGAPNLAQERANANAAIAAGAPAAAVRQRFKQNTGQEL